MFDLVTRDFNRGLARNDAFGGFGALSNIFDEMSTLFERFDTVGLGQNDFGKMNVYTKDDKSIIEVQTPGLSKDDIDITLEDGILTVSAESKVENEKDDNDYHLKEFSYSSFSRSIPVSEDISETDIDAKFEDGILKIEMPNKQIENKNIKRIEIK